MDWKLGVNTHRKVKKVNRQKVHLLVEEIYGEMREQRLTDYLLYYVEAYKPYNILWYVILIVCVYKTFRAVCHSLIPGKWKLFLIIPVYTFTYFSQNYFSAHGTGYTFILVIFVNVHLQCSHSQNYISLNYIIIIKYKLMWYPNKP